MERTDVVSLVEKVREIDRERRQYEDKLRALANDRLSELAALYKECDDCDMVERDWQHRLGLWELGTSEFRELLELEYLKTSGVKFVNDEARIKVYHKYAACLPESVEVVMSVDEFVNGTTEFQKTLAKHSGKEEPECVEKDER